MSRRSDTVSIISDDAEGATTVTVYSATFNYEARPHVELTSTIVSSATVMFFPSSGAFRKEIKGAMVTETDLVFFPWTSTISVGHRIKKTAADDYYEILEIGIFEDHKEVYARKVVNR